MLLLKTLPKSECSRKLAYKIPQHHECLQCICLWCICLWCISNFCTLTFRPLCWTISEEFTALIMDPHLLSPSILNSNFRTALQMVLEDRSLIFCLSAKLHCRGKGSAVQCFGYTCTNQLIVFLSFGCLRAQRGGILWHAWIPPSQLGDWYNYSCSKVHQCQAQYNVQGMQFPTHHLLPACSGLPAFIYNIESDVLLDHHHNAIC